jgi:hypothetical protein
VRRSVKQYFSLCQRLAHQAELIGFKVAQPTVDQFSAGRRRSTSQVTAFAQNNGKSATGGIGSNARTIHTATYHQKVYHGKRHRHIT